jgi:hypothetical protein
MKLNSMESVIDNSKERTKDNDYKRRTLVFGERKESDPNDLDITNT